MRNTKIMCYFGMLNRVSFSTPPVNFTRYSSAVNVDSCQLFCALILSRLLIG